MFKFFIDTLESVPENMRQYYAKDEESGKFKLQVEGAVSITKVQEFRDNASKLQNDLQIATTNLAKFKDIDPGKYQEYKTKAEAFKGDQDIEQIVTQRLEAATSQHRQTVTDLESKLASTTTDYHSSLIGNEVRSAAAKTGALPVALEDIVRRASGTFAVVNGKVVIQKDGQVVYGSDGVSPMTSVEWAKNLAKDAPYFFAENQGGGGQPGSFNTDVSRDKMTPAQKISAGLHQSHS